MEQLQAKMAEARAEANATARELNTKLREKTEELTAAQAMLESAKRATAETEAALQRAQSDLTAARAEVRFLSLMITPSLSLRLVNMLDFYIFSLASISSVAV